MGIIKTQQEFIGKSKRSGIPKGLQRISFCDYLRNFYSVKQIEIEPSSFNGYQNILENHIYPYFNERNTQFLAISSDEINTYLSYMAAPGYSFDAEYDDSHLFDGPGYIGIRFADGQASGQLFITNDIRAFYERQIRQDCPGTDISDETIGQYVHEKIIRFSKANTVFGRITDEDMDKLEHLNKRMVIKNIRFQ